MPAWNTEADATLLGVDAARAMDECETSVLLGDWPAQHAKRVKTSDGAAAWLWITKEGTLAALVVAPWNAIADADYVALGAMYGTPWPKEWRTKFRNGYVRVEKRKSGIGPFRAGDFAVAAGKGNKGGATLCRVIAVDDAGAPLMVQPGPHEPEIPATAFGGRQWASMAPWPHGTAEIWRKGWCVQGSFGNLARWAGIFEKRHNAKVAKKGKAAPGAAPQAPTKSNAYTASLPPAERNAMRRMLDPDADESDFESED